MLTLYIILGIVYLLIGVATAGFMWGIDHIDDGTGVFGCIGAWPIIWALYIVVIVVVHIYKILRWLFKRAALYGQKLRKKGR